MSTAVVVRLCVYDCGSVAVGLRLWVCISMCVLLKL